MEYTEAKSPDAVLDYTLDWSDMLASGESISSSAWGTSSPTGLTVDSDSETATTTTVFVSGGTGGVEYMLKNTIVTDNATPRTFTKTIIVPVLTQ